MMSSLKMESLNPCCVQWKTRYAKMEEKRNALRQGVEILKGQIDRLQMENSDLQRVLDEERARLNNVKEEKGTEGSLGISMKNEIAGFKSEICPTKLEAVVENLDLEKEVTQLQTCILERDVEIDRLRQLLAEERMKCDVEKKTAETERKKASELQNSLECEKNKAVKGCEMADAAATKAEDYRLQFETLKNEFEKTNLKLEEVKKIHEAEKHTVIKEREYAVEMRVKEVECHANTLLKQLKGEKQKVGRLQKEMQEMLSKRSIDLSELDEVKRKFETEKKKVAQEKRLVEEEKERFIQHRRIAEENEKMLSEERCRADTLVKQLEDEKQKVEGLQKQMHEIMLSKSSVDSSDLDEIKKKFEEEKKKVAREKRLVEEEKERVIEQRRIAEENEKMVSEERYRADTLIKQLEEEKQKVERLQKEMQEFMLSERSFDVSELNEVKRMLEEEKKKVAREKRLVEEEKLRVIELRRIAETSEKRFSEERCRADNLLMKLEEEKQEVEKLQTKLRDVTSQKTGDFSELEELKRILELEKENVALAKKSVEVEKARAIEQRSVAEAYEKRFFEEKCRADNLLMCLEEEKQKAGNLQREMQEVMPFPKTANSSRLDEVCRNLEAENKNVARERNHADLEKSNTEEQGKFAKAKEMKVIEEKQRCENLLHERENARQKLQNMERELHEVKLCMGLVGTSAMSPAFVMNEQAVRVGVLEEQLKFEKKRVKHAKEVSKLEKGRNNILQQELRQVKNDFQCLLDHLSMLSDIFGAKIGQIYPPQKLGPPQMHFRGDEELRMYGLASRDASCLQKPNMQLMQAGPCLESTSGMEIDLDPLQGGSCADTLPSSALNSNTTSFSDEQLVGSQGRLDGPITFSAGLSMENCNQRATVLRHCNEFRKRKTGKNLGTVDEHNPRSFVDTSTHHAKKRRKIFEEFESIKCMHSEGKKIFQEAEEKLYTLHNILHHSKLTEETEKENLPLTVIKSNLCGNIGCPSKKMMPLHEPAVCRQQAGECVMEMNVSPSIMETRENSQPLQIIVREVIKQNQDAVSGFEQMVNEDYMKLLELDDKNAEECFRMIMEKPLSPIHSEFDLLECGQEVEAQMLSFPISVNIEAAHDNLSDQIKNQLQFVMFSDMKDIGSKTRVICATRICVFRCLSLLQTIWSGHHILEALLLEKNMSPREKACVFFTSMLLNFSFVSSSKSANLHFQEQLDSFSAHIRSVLFIFQTRESSAKIFNLDDILNLSEDFILNKKIYSNNVPCELLDDCGSIIEILHDGEKILLCSKLASPDLVLAGSILLASISKAVGQVGFVCEASLKVLQTGKTEYSLALSILHTFAHICGEDYFTISNYSSIMKVVKSLVMFIEVSLTKNSIKDQPGETKHQFTPCVRCPFLEGSVSLNEVSLELLADLQRYFVPQQSAVSAHSNSEGLYYFVGDVLASIELVGSIKGWDWVYDIIVPKLFEMLASSHQDTVFFTTLVALLASLGRHGVKERGYDDSGVESVKRHLLVLLSQTTVSKCNAKVTLAIVYALIEFYPKGHEMFEKCFNVELPSKEGISASPSEIVSKFLSSLGSEQLTSLAGLAKSNVVITA